MQRRACPELAEGDLFLFLIFKLVIPTERRRACPERSEWKGPLRTIRSHTQATNPGTRGREATLRILTLASLQNNARRPKRKCSEEPALSCRRDLARVSSPRSPPVSPPSVILSEAKDLAFAFPSATLAEAHARRAIFLCLPADQQQPSCPLHRRHKQSHSSHSRTPRRRMRIHSQMAGLSSGPGRCKRTRLQHVCGISNQAA